MRWPGRRHTTEALARQLPSVLNELRSGAIHLTGLFSREHGEGFANDALCGLVRRTSPFSHLGKGTTGLSLSEAQRSQGLECLHVRQRRGRARCMAILRPIGVAERQTAGDGARNPNFPLVHSAMVGRAEHDETIRIMITAF
jgi:hypothetical protein